MKQLYIAIAELAEFLDQERERLGIYTWEIIQDYCCDEAEIRISCTLMGRRYSRAVPYLAIESARFNILIEEAKRIVHELNQ